MKKLILVLVLILLVAAVSSCADVVNVESCLPPEPAGFWGGLWNGITISFSWFGSLFSDNIAIYNVNNNGGWYNFGFVLGATGFGELMFKVFSKKK